MSPGPTICQIMLTYRLIKIILIMTFNNNDDDNTSIYFRSAICLFVSTYVINFMERLVSEMTCYV